MSNGIGQCESCYFHGKCISRYLCSDFSPMVQEKEDEIFEKRHEREKRAYKRAWIAYVSEFN